MSVQAKLEVVRRKHIVHLTGFGAFLLVPQNTLQKAYTLISQYQQ